jgi:methionyl aminopeptidase
LAHKYHSQYGIILKTPQEIEGIRGACKVAASILDRVCKMAHAGITTNALNEYAERLHREANARPAPLGFGDPPFPKSICTSPNDVICHGIPDDTPLVEGDIVSIDVSCEWNGYYGDCCGTVMIGSVSSEKELVTQVSYEALMQAIAILKPGIMLSEIGDVIQTYVNKKGCSTVTEFVGHGIGKAFREPPSVPHYRNNLAIPLAPGMTFTIEPMINAGRSEALIDADGWTARTVDGRASAQWEHMILITASGHEILTLPDT